MNKKLLVTIFLLPWIIGFFGYGIYPIIISFYYSLCHYDVLQFPMFIGFSNYIEIFFNDPYFWKSISNTFIYTFFRVPLNIILSLILAVLINQISKGSSLFRTAYFVPSLVSGVALSVIWMWIFNPQIGLFNIVLTFFWYNWTNVVTGSKLVEASLDYNEFLEYRGRKNVDIFGCTKKYFS